MLAVDDWYSIVKKMSEDLANLPVDYFFMYFTKDEAEAAFEFLSKRHGWCPTIHIPETIIDKEKWYGSCFLTSTK